MAEFTKPKSPFVEYRRELLITVILGFGSVFFSLGSFLLYAEPPRAELKVVLAARTPTSPRESLARRSQRESLGARADRSSPPVVASASATPQTAPAPAASGAPTAAVSEARRETVAAPPPPVVVAAVPARPERPSNERVRTIRTRIGGEWVEVQDFTRGVTYTGEIHDFSSGSVPRSIRERERSQP